MRVVAIAFGLTLTVVATLAGEPDVPAYQPHAVQILDSGLNGAWEMDDPRDHVESLLDTLARIDPQIACERIRVASDRIAGDMHWPPSRSRVQGRLAKLVAPHNKALRDEIIKRAILDAEDALAEDKLWFVPPPPRGSTGWGDPRHSRAQEKKMLRLKVRLWTCLLEYPDNQKKIERDLKTLFTDASQMGTFGGCVQWPLEDALRRELAWLDTPLLLKIGAEQWGERKFALYCADQACFRWVNGHRDKEFTGRLILFAADHDGIDMFREFKMLRNFSVERAWQVALADGFESRDRELIIRKALSDLAWKDPAKAMNLAQQIDLPVYGSASRSIANVWVQHSPHQLADALYFITHDYYRKRTIETAKAERAWRKAGNAPRDTPEKFRQWQLQSQAKKSGTQQVAPKSRPLTLAEKQLLTELVEKSDADRTEQRNKVSTAGWNSYVRTGRLEGIRHLLSLIEDEANRNALLNSVTGRIAEYGRPADVHQIIEFVESPRMYCVVAKTAAEAFMRRPASPNWRAVEIRPRPSKPFPNGAVITLEVMP